MEETNQAEYVDLSFKKKCPADLHLALSIEAKIRGLYLYEYVMQILINRDNRDNKTPVLLYALALLL